MRRQVALNTVEFCPESRASFSVQNNPKAFAVETRTSNPFENTNSPLKPEARSQPRDWIVVAVAEVAEPLGRIFCGLSKLLPSFATATEQPGTKASLKRARRQAV